jgi:small subunit ribosomal protein S16
MAVTIRLRRTGSNKDPFYRIVAADKRFATGGRYLENLGWYNPKKTPSLFQIELERVEYWLGCGAQISDTVKMLVKKAKARKPA